MTRAITIWGIFAFAVLCGSVAWGASDYDFAGNFIYDNDVLQFNFTVEAESDVTIFSSSWDDGGFDPILAFWDTGGNLIYQQDDGHNIGTTLSNGVPYDHGNWDTYFTEHLTAGDYIATITQYNNFANSSALADGFRHDGNPNFTYDLGYGSQAYFNGVLSGSDPRTSAWVFHILNVGEARITEPTNDIIPAPGAVLLGGLGVGLVSWLRRRRAL